MKIKNKKGLVGLLLLCSFTWAQAQEFEREVGSDGVPVIKIRGDAPAAANNEVQEIPREPRKAFRVYQMQGAAPAQAAQTQVVVVGSPPPVYPNPAAFNGFGVGNQFFGPGNFSQGGFQSFNGGGFRSNRGFRSTGFSTGRGFNNIRGAGFPSSSLFTPRSTFTSSRSFRSRGAGRSFRR